VPLDNRSIDCIIKGQEREKMTNTEATTILKSMGYREMKTGIWGKPIGNSLLIARIDNEKWILRGYFKGHRKIYLWAKRNFECMETLKSAELQCFRATYISSNFEFLSNEEYLESIL
jgi:hypothetical protein